MNLSVGIVGLPNVGKSTLFNAITNSQVEAANYPFATIDPNTGIAIVKDKRLDQLCDIINPKKKTYAICKFIDIAGLVKDASKGQGLGNKFLANIRETDAICHIVRCFADKNITHVYNTVDPIRDVEIINLELIVSDIEVVDKKIEKYHRKALSGDEKSLIYDTLYAKVKKHLLQNKLVKDLELSDDEKKIISMDNFLTFKPTIYIANIDEENINDYQNNIFYQKLKSFINPNDKIIPLSIRFEQQITELSELERNNFIKDFGIKETGLSKLIFEAYKILNLSSFFTFGQDEVKAWTFINGMNAQECAGLIHTDIKKGFIRAEVMKCDDLIKYGSENKVKEAGLLRLEGKNYLMNDGDVCYFRFNI